MKVMMKMTMTTMMMMIMMRRRNRRRRRRQIRATTVMTTVMIMTTLKLKSVRRSRKSRSQMPPRKLSFAEGKQLPLPKRKEPKLPERLMMRTVTVLRMLPKMMKTKSKVRQ